MKTRIKQLREKLKLSQQALAKKAGTSQQEIQRIESGRSAARLELAKAIADALGKPFDKVFPSASKLLVKMYEDMEKTPYLPSSETYDEINAHGIEADPAEHTLRCLFKGHDEPFLFRVSGATKRRLYRAIQLEGANTGNTLPIVVFDSDSARLAINLSELEFCQFLFDAPGQVVNETDEEREGRNSVQVYFRGSAKPYYFSVDQDEPTDEDMDEMGQFADIFYHLDVYVEDGERYCFRDQDGEDVFIRAQSIAMLSVPLWVLEPNSDEEDEDDALQQETDVAKAQT
jgi:DNA-binding XRE family transcriptional regulator